MMPSLPPAMLCDAGDTNSQLVLEPAVTVSAEQPLFATVIAPPVFVPRSMNVTPPVEIAPGQTVTVGVTGVAVGVTGVGEGGIGVTVGTRVEVGAVVDVLVGKMITGTVGVEVGTGVLVG